jgi:hypothetical protein
VVKRRGTGDGIVWSDQLVQRDRIRERGRGMLGVGGESEEKRPLGRSRRR